MQAAQHLLLCAEAFSADCCFVCVRLVLLVDQRSGKGKPESADNIEKFDRNCKKLGENATQRTAVEWALHRSPHARFVAQAASALASHTRLRAAAFFSLVIHLLFVCVWWCAEEIRASYTELNTRIMGELNRLWEADRVRVMGPIMCRFIAQEKKVAEAYTEALQQIKVSSASPVPQ